MDGSEERLNAAVSALAGMPLSIETEQQFFATLNLPYTEELKYALF
jgi:hypothetical protein